MPGRLAAFRYSSIGPYERFFNELRFELVHYSRQLKPLIKTREAKLLHCASRTAEEASDHIIILCL
jgi:hypothetical protein